eukprot:605627_1
MHFLSVGIDKRTLFYICIWFLFCFCFCDFCLLIWLCYSFLFFYLFDDSTPDTLYGGHGCGLKVPMCVDLDVHCAICRDDSLLFFCFHCFLACLCSFFFLSHLCFGGFVCLLLRAHAKKK